MFESSTANDSTFLKGIDSSQHNRSKPLTFTLTLDNKAVRAEE